MILDISLIISSILLGSTFSKIFAKILVFQKGMNLFSSGLLQNIPGFNLNTALQKSFDLTEFILFIVISLLVFALLFYIRKKMKNEYSIKTEALLGIGNITFAFLVYLSVMFVNYSGTKTIFFSIIWYLLISSAQFFIPKKIPEWKTNKIACFNGIATGFYLLILLNNLNTSIALPLAVFITTPIYFFIFSNRFRILKSPAFILLIFSFIFPFNRLALFGIFLITAVTIFALNKIPSVKINTIVEKIYPFAILCIFLYNPLFYSGTFDSIEEGFWSGWLQRLLSGQFIYRDFAAYHPPALIWGLFLFVKAFGASLYNQRLYFHLLQIIGLITLYLVLRSITKSKIIQIGIFILIFAYSSALVRNNIEIRVGSALVPLLFIYWSYIKRSKPFLFLAGATTVFAFFISIETGIASLAATALAACFAMSKKTWLKDSLYIILGGLIITVPILGFLVLRGAFGKFLEYIIYYAQTFSNGYENLPLQWPVPQTILQWYLVIQYINSSGFLWELAKSSLVGGLLLTIVRKIRNNFGPSEILAFGISIFGLVLSRSALGRSDEYHIAFVLIPALILIGYALGLLEKYTKVISIFVITILIFFISADQTQISLVQNELTKFETYGNPAGTYPSYSTKRAGIITGIEVKPSDLDNLVKFVDSNVNKNQTIFVFPQEPEIYFLTDRNDATSFDTPTTFYTLNYQNQMISELKNKPPKLIIYRQSSATEDATNGILNEVNKYIINNYKVTGSFGEESVMQHI